MKEINIQPLTVQEIEKLKGIKEEVQQLKRHEVFITVREQNRLMYGRSLREKLLQEEGAPQTMDTEISRQIKIANVEDVANIKNTITHYFEKIHTKYKAPLIYVGVYAEEERIKPDEIGYMKFIFNKNYGTVQLLRYEYRRLKKLGWQVPVCIERFSIDMTGRFKMSRHLRNPLVEGKKESKEKIVFKSSDNKITNEAKVAFTRFSDNLLSFIE